MDILIIPLAKDPSERFTINLDGAVYSIQKFWCEIASSWYLNIKGLTNAVSLKGLSLATNVDLLAPHAVLELGNMLMIDMEGQNKDPDYEGIGTRFQLVYVPKGQL